jgi:hypothetical protein
MNKVEPKIKSTFVYYIDGQLCFLPAHFLLLTAFSVPFKFKFKTKNKNRQILYHNYIVTASGKAIAYPTVASIVAQA